MVRPVLTLFGKNVKELYCFWNSSSQHILALPTLELPLKDDLEGLEIMVLMRIKLSFHGCFLFLLLSSASGGSWKTIRRYAYEA
jgi:hypothetical protein